MIAYRAEIWCDGPGAGAMCPYRAGHAEGIAHDDVYSLPQLAKNQEEILAKQGWKKIDGKHYCPRCSKARERAA